MGKVILLTNANIKAELNFSKKDDFHFMIEVDADSKERISITAPTENYHKWYIALICNSFEDIPRMKGQAMQQLKIKKAVNQG